MLCEGKRSAVSQQHRPLPWLPCPSGRGAARPAPMRGALSLAFPGALAYVTAPEKTSCLHSSFPETTLAEKSASSTYQLPSPSPTLLPTSPQPIPFP